MDLVMHSYSFRDYPLAHVMRTAAGFGFGHVELSGLHLDDTTVADAVALGRRHGVEVYCAGYLADLSTGDATARRASIAAMTKLVDESAGAGVALVNGFAGWVSASGDLDDWISNGTAIATEDHYRWTADAYRELVEYATPRGVTIAVEVHPNTVHDTIAGTVRLLDEVPGLVATADPANAYVISEADRNPRQLPLLGTRLRYFHVKNCLPGGRRADFTVDADAGVVDNAAWFAAIAAQGGVPAIALEYCGAGDPHPRIVATRDYVIRTIGRG